MKTKIIIIWMSLILLILFASGYGTTKTNSILILDDKSGIDFTDSAIELVNRYAGEVYHVFRSKVLMGYVPPDNVAHLIGKAGILNIHQSQTQPDRADPIVNYAIKAFNALLQPVKELTDEEIREKGLHQWKEGIGVVHLTEEAKTHHSDRLTSEYMIGRAAVGILIIEGNGDPQYNWTPQGMDSVSTQIVRGLDWLANKASVYNTNICWFYDLHYSVPVNGEPITGSSGIEYTMEDNVIWWIAQAMSSIGYGSGDLGAVYSYVNNLRSVIETDWAFAIFVVNGGTFQDGYSGWAMRWDQHYLYHHRIHGGPYVVMTRDNGPYGLGNMYRVLRHETCHTFGAADEKEWSDDCRGTDDCYVKWGYFQIENSNCYYCPGEQEQCLMHNLFSEDICIWTRHQLGWRDSDGDGPADPIDPNSHRYCWIGPNEVGPAYFGDKIKVWTIDDEPEFVKSIVVTPDNCQPRDDGCCAVMWDGTNAWGEVCAPGIYIATVNDGSSHSILLRAIDPNSTSRPAFSNIQFENGVLYWRLDDCWAYVRLKIYNSSNQLVLYPIKDKVYLPNVYYGNDHYQTDLYGLIEGTTYTAEFFGWCPPGHRSDTTRYSFVFHGPAVLSPNGGELWQAQTTHDITWNFPGVSGNVKIQYSTDGGATWKTIAGSTSNDGTYSWTLPCFCDTLPACRIKVSDWEDGIPWDVSDDDFSIVPPYTIAPSNLTGSQSAPD